MVYDFGGQSQQPNIFGQFIGGLQAGQMVRGLQAQNQQLLMAEQRAKNLPQIKKLQSVILTGQPWEQDKALSDLGKLSPDDYEPMAKTMLQLRKTKFEDAELSRQDNASRVARSESVWKAIAENPSVSTLGAVLPQAEEQGIIPAGTYAGVMKEISSSGDQASASYIKSWAENMAEAQKITLSVYRDPERNKQTVQFLALLDSAKGLSDQEKQKMTVDFLKKMSTHAPATNVNVLQGGGQALSRATEARVESDIIESVSIASKLEDIYESFRPEYVGPVQSAMISVASKLGPLNPIEAFTSRAITWRAELERILNDYKVEITGAGASQREIDALKDAIANPSRYTPATFRSMLLRFMRGVIKEAEVKNYFRTQGMPREQWRGVKIPQDSELPGVVSFDLKYGTPELGPEVKQSTKNEDSGARTLQSIIGSELFTAYNEEVRSGRHKLDSEAVGAAIDRVAPMFPKHAKDLMGIKGKVPNFRLIREQEGLK